MKPEEIDRLFREELEKLDRVPGIEWNDESGWDKINHYLKGGLNTVWTWTLSAITALFSICLIYHLLTSQDTSIAQQNKKLPKETVVIKEDSTVQRSEKKFTPFKRKKLAIKTISPVQNIRDTFAIDPQNKLSLPSERIDTLITNSRSRKLFNRFEFMNTSCNTRKLAFSMPHFYILKLKVNNGFNFSNLAKSIKAEKEAGESFYYFYEYNKIFVPPLNGNTHPKLNIHNTYTITNFNR